MFQRINTVVNGLLTFSRREEARRPLSVNELVLGTVGLVERGLAVSGIVVRRELNDNVARVDANGPKLKQALMNVMLNARDAMPGGGILTIATGMEGSSVSISCTDTGKGIRERDLTRVFDAFYTTKKQGHGAGLGLYICQSIVDEHGGRIHVDSEVRKGTSVTMLLPAALDPESWPLRSASLSASRSAAQLEPVTAQAAVNGTGGKG
jgi:signal transduction histidine kinase